MSDLQNLNLLQRYGITKDDLDTNLALLTPQVSQNLFNFVSQARIDETSGELVIEDKEPDFGIDHALIALISRVRNQLHIRYYNDDFQIKIAKHINIYFFLTSMFEYLDTYAIALLEENQVQTGSYSNTTKKVLNEIVETESPEDILVAVKELGIFDGILKQMISSLTNYHQNQCGPGRKNYFLAYWLCSQISSVLKEYKSSKSVVDLQTVLVEVEKDYPQFFDNFPQLEYEALRQALKLWKNIEKATTQDTATEV